MQMIGIMESRAEHIANAYSSELESAYSRDPGAVGGMEDSLSVVNYLKGSGSQYLQWTVEQYIAGNFRMDELTELAGLLKRFVSASRLMPDGDRNLSKYDVSSLDDMLSAYKDVGGDVSHVKSKKRKKDRRDLYSNGEIEKFYSDGDMTIYIPHTAVGNCFLGRGTNWCTDNGKDSVYDKHKESLYVIRLSTGEKYQLYKNSDNGVVEVRDRHNKIQGVSTLLDAHPKLREIFKDDDKLAAGKEFIGPADYYEYANSLEVDDKIRYGRGGDDVDRTHSDVYIVDDIGTDFVLARSRNEKRVSKRRVDDNVSKRRFNNELLLIMNDETYHMTFSALTLLVEDYDGKIVLENTMERILTSGTHRDVLISLLYHTINKGYLRLTTYKVLRDGGYGYANKISQVIYKFGFALDEFYRSRTGLRGSNENDRKQIKELKRLWLEIPKSLKNSMSTREYESIIRRFEQSGKSESGE